MGWNDKGEMEPGRKRWMYLLDLSLLLIFAVRLEDLCKRRKDLRGLVECRATNNTSRTSRVDA